jgi:hypothetical protein
MQIRELFGQWPQFWVWGAAGSTWLLVTKLPTATIKGALLKGDRVALFVDNQGQEFNTTIGPFDDQHLAKRVSATLKGAIGKTVQDAGNLEVKEVREIRVVRIYQKKNNSQI